MAMSPAVCSQYSKSGSNPNVPQLWSADKLHAVCLYKSMAEKGGVLTAATARLKLEQAKRKKPVTKGHLLWCHLHEMLRKVNL